MPGEGVSDIGRGISDFLAGKAPPPSGTPLPGSGVVVPILLVFGIAILLFLVWKMIEEERGM